MKNYEIGSVVQLMLTELSGVARVSENTIAAYKRDLDQFIVFCEEKKCTDIRHITDKLIRHYLVYMNSEKLAAASVSRKLSSLRYLFNFAFKHDIIEKNPAIKIPNPKIRRKLPDTLQLDSYENIFRLIDEDIDNRYGKRDKAIFELLYGCAIRVSEMCGLNFGDIDLAKKQLRVLGKGSKVRIIPIGEKSIQIINDYLSTVTFNSISQPAFFNESNRRLNRFQAYKIINKYLKKEDTAEIKKKSPHLLRHSAATHMLDKGADIMAVKEILGHESLSTTQIYTHVSVERLKASYKKAHPKS